MAITPRQENYLQTNCYMLQYQSLTDKRATCRPTATCYKTNHLQTREQPADQLLHATTYNTNHSQTRVLPADQLLHATRPITHRQESYLQTNCYMLQDQSLTDKRATCIPTATCYKTNHSDKRATCRPTATCYKTNHSQTRELPAGQLLHATRPIAHRQESNLHTNCYMLQDQSLTDKRATCIPTATCYKTNRSQTREQPAD